MSEETKQDPGADRIDARFVALIGQVLAQGASKHGDTWRTKSPERHMQSALRHFRALSEGQRLDPESGLPHIGHLATRLMMLYCTELDQVT